MNSTNDTTLRLNQPNLINYVNITTNKALVLSLSNSLAGSPINSLSNQTRSIMNALTVEKFTISDLEQKLNSETDLNSFLDQIEISKSLPFTKSQDMLDDDECDEKFQIKIRVKEDSNLKLGSIQLLSSEEMFELHCGDTNEYMCTVNCDFIDKLDQQFIINYGCHNLAQNFSSLTLLRNESFLKKALNIVFPKFSTSGNDTIWIFAIKLNLVECRSSNLANSAFPSMSNMLPILQMMKQLSTNKSESSNLNSPSIPSDQNELRNQMLKQFKERTDSNVNSPSIANNQHESNLRNQILKQIKECNESNDENSPSASIDIQELRNQINLKHLNLPSNVVQALPPNLQNLFTKRPNQMRPKLMRSTSVDSQEVTKKESQKNRSKIRKPKLSLKLGLKKRRKLIGQSKNDQILKKLNNLSEKIDLIDQKLCEKIDLVDRKFSERIDSIGKKLSDLQLEVS